MLLKSVNHSDQFYAEEAVFAVKIVSVKIVCQPFDDSRHFLYGIRNQGYEVRLVRRIRDHGAATPLTREDQRVECRLILLTDRHILLIFRGACTFRIRLDEIQLLPALLNELAELDAIGFQIELGKLSNAFEDLAENFEVSQSSSTAGQFRNQLGRERCRLKSDLR